jgi:hypothetical protein
MLNCDKTPGVLNYVEMDETALSLPHACVMCQGILLLEKPCFCCSSACLSTTTSKQVVRRLSTNYITAAANLSNSCVKLSTFVNFQVTQSFRRWVFFENCGNLQQTTSIVVVQCCVSSSTSVHNLDQSTTAKASSTIKKV